MPTELGRPGQQFYGQLYDDADDDPSYGGNDATAVGLFGSKAVRLWPRFMNIGSKTDEVDSLFVRGDLNVTQLRLRGGVKISLGGKIRAGVPCGIDVDGDDATTEGSVRADKLNQASSGKVDDNVLILPDGNLTTSTTAPYRPRCAQYEEENYVGVPFQRHSGRAAAEIPVIGLEVHKANDDNTIPANERSAKIITRKLSAVGEETAVPVFTGTGSGADIRFRYKCLEVGRGDLAQDCPP